ncbi:MAG TPA: hypothetical protein VL092_00245 [Chitinophagaceae bacterium]|nr:hypothetical protein [Chitinophagaceae bacterium]
MAFFIESVWNGRYVLILSGWQIKQRNEMSSRRHPIIGQAVAVRTQKMTGKAERQDLLLIPAEGQRKAGDILYSGKRAGRML